MTPSVHHERLKKRYEAIDRSELLPAFDREAVEGLMNAATSQAQAIREFRTAPRKR